MHKVTPGDYINHGHLVSSVVDQPYILIRSNDGEGAYTFAGWGELPSCEYGSGSDLSCIAWRTPARKEWDVSTTFDVQVRAAVWVKPGEMGAWVLGGANPLKRISIRYFDSVAFLVD